MSGTALHRRSKPHGAVEGSPLEVVRDALALSLQCLDSHPEELPSQLTGRILDDPARAIRRLLEDVQAQTNWPWLRPLRASLQGASSPLRLQLRAHVGRISCIALDPARKRAFTGSDDDTVRVWDLVRGTSSVLDVGGRQDAADRPEPLNGPPHKGAGEVRVRSGTGSSAAAAWPEPPAPFRRGDLAGFRGFDTGPTGVTCLALERETGCLVAGTGDGTLRCWPRIDEPCIEIRPHASQATALALDLGRDRVFSASDDGSICAWNPRAGTHSMLCGHAGAVTCLALEASGTRLVSGSADRTVRLWNLASGMGCVFRGHEEEITCVAIDLSGQRLVSSAENGAIRVWQLADGSGRLVSPRVDTDSGIFSFRTEDGLNFLLHEEHGSAIEQLIVDRSASQALSWSPKDGALRLWDLETGSCRDLGAPAAPRSRASGGSALPRLAPDSGFPPALATASSGLGSTIRLWDLVRGTHRDVLSQGASQSHALAYDPLGQQLASGSHDGVFRLWDLSRDLGQGEPEQIANSISSVALDHSGERLVFSSTGGVVGTWQPGQGDIRYYKADHFNVNTLAIDRDAHRAATVDVNGQLRVWDLVRGRPRQVRLREDECSCAAIAPSGEHVVFGSKEGVLRIWQQQSGEHRELGRQERGIRRIALSSCGTRAIAVSSNGEIRLWSVRDGSSRLLEPNPVILGMLTAKVAFDAELANVAIVWWKKWIRIWDIELGHWTLLEDPSSEISCAQVHGRSGRVVFGTEDGWIRFWSARDNKVSPLGWHAGGYGGVAALAPAWELGLVASTANDASIRVWPLDGLPGRCMDQPRLGFSNDLGAKFTDLAARGRVLVAGDSDGRIHCFRLEGMARRDQ